MPNPDAKNIDSGLANTPPKFKRKASAGAPSIPYKTASWPGLPGKTGPNRSLGVKKIKIYPDSEGI